MVGNKADLDHLRDVPLKVAEDFARMHSLLLFKRSLAFTDEYPSEKNGLAFMETSALKNTGVNEAYTALVSGILLSLLLLLTLW